MKARLAILCAGLLVGCLPEGAKNAARDVPAVAPGSSGHETNLISFPTNGERISATYTNAYPDAPKGYSVVSNADGYRLSSKGLQDNSKPVATAPIATQSSSGFMGYAPASLANHLFTNLQARVAGKSASTGIRSVTASGDFYWGAWGMKHRINPDFYLKDTTGWNSVSVGNWFTPNRQSSPITATQGSNGIVTASAPFFSAADVWRWIEFGYPDKPSYQGQIRGIKQYVNPTTVVVDKTNETIWLTTNPEIFTVSAPAWTFPHHAPMTLISPRHVLTSGHVLAPLHNPVADGHWVRFLTTNGTAVDREIIDVIQYTHGGVGTFTNRWRTNWTWEISVGLLSREVTGVPFSKFIPPNFTNKISNFSAITYVGKNQDNYYQITDPSGKLAGWRLAQPRAGDSGSPNWLLIGNELVLMDIALSSWNAAFYSNTLNSTMSELVRTNGGGTNYQIEFFNLDAFPDR